MKGILYTILICFCTLLFQNKPAYAQSLTDEALIDLINAKCLEHHDWDDEDDDKHDKKKHDKDDKKKHDDKDDSEDCYKQLKNTLSANTPLSDTVLIAAINRTPSLPPGILKDILLDNSPLSNRIFAELLTTKRKKKDKDKGKDEDEEDDDNGEEDDDDEVDATLKGLVLPPGILKKIFEAQPCEEVVADFTHDAPKQVGQGINFVNIGTTGSDVLYSWNFLEPIENLDTLILINTSMKENPKDITFSSPGFKTIVLSVFKNGCVAQDIQTIYIVDTLPTLIDTIEVRFLNYMNVIFFGLLELSKNQQFIDVVNDEVSKKTIEDDFVVLFQTLNQRLSLQGFNLLDSMKKSIEKHSCCSPTDQDLVECILNSFQIGNTTMYPSLAVPNFSFANRTVPPIMAIGSISRRKESNVVQASQIKNGVLTNFQMTSDQYNAENIWLVEAHINSLDEIGFTFLNFNKRCWCVGERKYPNLITYSSRCGTKGSNALTSTRCGRQKRRPNGGKLDCLPCGRGLGADVPSPSFGIAPNPKISVYYESILARTFLSFFK